MESLQILAETAIALAGFSSIIVIFRRAGAHGAWEPEDVFRLRIMLRYGLIAAGFAVIPAAFLGVGLSPVLLWPTVSGMLVVFLAVDLHVQQRAVRTLPKGSLNPTLAVFMVMGNVVVLIIQGINIFGWGLPSGSGPYLFGVTWLTISAGMMFYRLITAPIVSSK